MTSLQPQENRRSTKIQLDGYGMTHSFEENILRFISECFHENVHHTSGGTAAACCGSFPVERDGMLRLRSHEVTRRREHR